MFIQVGLLIMLSLLLRSMPAALLLRSQALLLAGKVYSGPSRLPLLLWLINQTARCAHYLIAVYLYMYPNLHEGGAFHICHLSTALTAM